MIIRVVRMEFTESSLPAFLDVFEGSKAAIRAFPGCRRLQLLADARQPWVRYTYSHWDDEAALEAYRQSELFARTWAATKALFGGRPLAYSMVLEQEVGEGM